MKFCLLVQVIPSPLPPLPPFPNIIYSPPLFIFLPLPFNFLGGLSALTRGCLCVLIMEKILPVGFYFSRLIFYLIASFSLNATHPQILPLKTSQSVKSFILYPPSQPPPLPSRSYPTPKTPYKLPFKPSF